MMAWMISTGSLSTKDGDTVAVDAIIVRGGSKTQFWKEIGYEITTEIECDEGVMLK